MDLEHVEMIPFDSSTWGEVMTEMAEEDGAWPYSILMYVLTELPDPVSHAALKQFLHYQLRRWTRGELAGVPSADTDDE